MSRYFNYTVSLAEARWERRSFLKKWWSIYADDPRWPPPFWPQVLHALAAVPPPHLARMAPILVALEALPRRRTLTTGSPGSLSASPLGLSGPLFEETVAAGILLRDLRRGDATAYLAELHVANDQESLERLLHRAQELLEPAGVRQLILPTGFSLHLQTGVLQDYFDHTPPLYTPYAPPYAPELLRLACRPLGRSQLHRIPVPEAPSAPSAGPARLVPLEPQRLAQDLLPLLAAALPAWPASPQVDEPEAQFLMGWLEPWPVYAWLAELDGAPAGFILMQPDAAHVLHRAHGGRNLLWRAWLRWRARRPFEAGRLVWGGVHPDARNRGVGDQLWRQALATAASLGWRVLTAGPLPSTAPGHGFLLNRGSQITRSYLLHRYEFS